MRRSLAGSSAGESDPVAEQLTTIARSVAYLAMHAAELTNEDLATKVDFLERLGLSRADCARILETTAESIRVTMAQRARAKSPRRSRRARR